MTAPAETGGARRLEWHTLKLIENPVTVKTSRTRKNDHGWSFASADIMRSASTPPHPASWSRQKAWFLFAKNGVGWTGSTAIRPLPLARKSRSRENFAALFAIAYAAID